MSFRRAVFGLVLLMFVPLSVTVPVPAARAAVPAVPEVDPVVQAFAAARGAGEPVEIPSQTTELMRTLANPDGTYTLEAATTPQRTEENGTWVPIDTSLVLGADGRYEPRHASVGLEFSSGGSGPAVSFTKAGTTMRWTWSTPLPPPTIEGDTAVYAEVLPGVDLRLTANETSFSEVLVIRTAEAGRHAAVLKPTFGPTVENGTAVNGPNDTFRVLDDTGAPVIESVTPLMWDSSGEAAGRNDQVSDPTVADIPGPEAGAEVAPMKASVAAGLLTLTPDAALLANPALTYPLYLDPTAYSAGMAGRWAMVDKTYPETKYFKWTDTDQGSGYRNRRGVSTKRLLWEFSLGSRLYRTTVTKAVFYARETYAASCEPMPVGVWQIGNFGAATKWNEQPTWVGTSALATRSVSFGRAGCPTKTDANGNKYVAASPQQVDFNVTNYVQTLNTSTAAYARLGLRAGSETNPDGWKRFSRSGTILSVTYDHAPTLVAGSARNNTLACVAASTAATLKTFPSTAMTLNSTWKDLDNDKLTVAFVLINPAGTAVSFSAGPTGMSPTSHQATFTVKTGVLKTAGLYKWVASATEQLTSRTKKTVTGPSCYFRIDPTAPGPPVLTSGGADSLETSAGTTVTLDVARGLTNGADTVKYAYAVNGDTPVASTAKTVLAGAGTSFSVRISSSGPNSVSVWAYDTAGNVSAPSSFPVKAVGWVPARWTLDQGSVRDVAASSPPASEAVPDPACVPTGTGTAMPSPLRWQKGAAALVAGISLPRAGNTQGDNALGFAASVAASTAVTTGIAPMVTTAAESPNYTVMAWVQIPNGGVDDMASPSTVAVAKQTIWSVAGATGPVAKLELVSESGTPGGAARFRFSVLTSTGVVSVTADAELDAGWWRLSASVAPDSEEIQLAVMDTNNEVGAKSYQLESADGAIVPPTGAFSVSPSAPTTGSMAVARFTGSVDDVRIFRGALTGATSQDAQVDGDVLTWLQKVRSDASATDDTCTVTSG